MGIAGWLASFFATSKVQDLAIDGLRQISGLNDMTPQEKADYILKYMDATRHQSPVRRLIALLLTVLYGSIIMVWVIAAGVGYYFNVVPSLEFAGAVKVFMESTIVQPFNIILAFYFVTQITGKFGK